MSNLVLKKMKKALWQPVESPRQAAGDESDVAALAREFERTLAAAWRQPGQRLGRQERVVLGVEQQRRQRMPVSQGLLDALRQ
jgi:hypothetical protein